MRIRLAILLSSPFVGTLLHLAHLGALLLLRRNQPIRQRFIALVETYSLVHSNHSYPHSGEYDPADSHPDVIAALRPILAIEAMLTDWRYQTVLANYRRACLQGDDQAIKLIEQWVTAMLELRPDDRAAEPLHAVG